MSRNLKNSPKEKLCVFCGTQFTALYQSTQFCSGNCARKKWSKENPSKTEPSSISIIKRRTKKFGISLHVHDTMLAAQKGKCAICKKNDRTRKLAIDHNHRTMEVRGLLCTRCNMGLGYFDDDPERLKSAITYLTR